MTSKTDLPLERSPVRKARERLGYSLKEVSKKAGVNYQTWYNTECACYGLIPLAVGEFLEKEGFSSAWLDKEYSDYIRRSRAEFFLNYHELFERIGYSGANSPVQEFREFLGLSRSGFAKELCVQPAILYKVESGKSKNLPQQLARALLEVGLTEKQFVTLRKAVREWARQ